VENKREEKEKGGVKKKERTEVCSEVLMNLSLTSRKKAKNMERGEEKEEEKKKTYSLAFSLI